MPERFYIWEDDERSGPYSEKQVGRMLEDGIITFAHECESASGKRVKLDELFEPFDEEEEELETEEEEPTEEGEKEGADEEWEYEDEEEDADAAEDEDEEWEYEEEDEELAAADELDDDEEEWDEESDGPPPGAVLYYGHPTFFRYIGGFALAALGIAFGLWLGPKSIWFFIGGFSVAVLTLIAIFVDRSTRLYAVTPKRVEMDWGLIARSSKEVRIEDIRTINVKKSGFGGMLGIGTVEFSSTGDGVDVAFTDIWGAKKVKLLVRKLQDEME